MIKRKQILVIGSSNTDMVVKTEKLPLPGETVLGGKFFMNPGGKGANQAVAISRLGGNVTFITKIGNDIFGQQSVENYKKEKINTKNIFTDNNKPSGVALITVDNKAENCIVVASGANDSLSPSDIDKVISEIEKSEIIIMQLEIPMETVEYVAKLASKKGIKVILNPAPAPNKALSNELLKNLYAIMPNSREAEILSGIKVCDVESAKKAADVIANKGVKIVIITLGSRGSLIKESGNYHFVEALKVNAVDSTAAGDTFCGALCVGLMEKMSILESVKMATKASAISVTRMGAQSSIPYRNEI